jgi:hypothetical protein
MGKSKWQEEKMKREREALERHAQLHKLFREDRLAFERERKRILDEFFDGIEDKEMRNKLKGLQRSWDTKMKHAGSAHNRFVLAQTVFWNHVHDKWSPALKQFESILEAKPDRPPLRVVKENGN